MKTCMNCVKNDVCALWDRLCEEAETPANILTPDVDERGDVIFGDSGKGDRLSGKKLQKWHDSVVNLRDENQLQILNTLGKLRGELCESYLGKK